MKTIEEQLGRQDTLNLKDEYKTSLKINRYGGVEDASAWNMLNELKRKNINVSKHLRMLLALEFEGKLILPQDVAVKSFSATNSTPIIGVEQESVTSISDDAAIADVKNVAEEYVAPGDDSIFD